VGDFEVAIGVKEIATHLSYFNFCRNKDNPANMMNLGISA
jgi:hypothetical protein